MSNEINPYILLAYHILKEPQLPEEPEYIKAYFAHTRLNEREINSVFYRLIKKRYKPTHLGFGSGNWVGNDYQHVRTLFQDFWLQKHQSIIKSGTLYDLMIEYIIMANEPNLVGELDDQERAIRAHLAVCIAHFMNDLADKHRSRQKKEITTIPIKKAKKVVSETIFEINQSDILIRLYSYDFFHELDEKLFHQSGLMPHSFFFCIAGVDSRQNLQTPVQKWWMTNVFKEGEPFTEKKLFERLQAANIVPSVKTIKYFIYKKSFLRKNISFFIDQVYANLQSHEKWYQILEETIDYNLLNEESTIPDLVRLILMRYCPCLAKQFNVDPLPDQLACPFFNSESHENHQS